MKILLLSGIILFSRSSVLRTCLWTLKGLFSKNSSISLAYWLIIYFWNLSQYLYFFRIPDEVIDMVKEDITAKAGARGGGRGRGGNRGRGGRGGAFGGRGGGNQGGGGGRGGRGGGGGGRGGRGGGQRN